MGEAEHPVDAVVRIIDERIDELVAIKEGLKEPCPDYERQLDTRQGILTDISTVLLKMKEYDDG